MNAHGEYAHDYKIKIYLWTGDMNTYHAESLNGLSKDYAEKLFDVIQADGGVTQVDMWKGSKRIKSKDDEGVLEG